MVDLLGYIRTHENWREELSNAPYCLTIKDDGPYTMLSYSQINSDFNNNIVRECRGVVIKCMNEKLRLYDKVCNPFTKFGNWRESYVPKIDWETAVVEEKIDGSLMKVWFDNGWHISTNNTIDAFKANLGDVKYQNFGKLFLDTLHNYFKDEHEFFGRLNKHFTYMFELTTPYNQVVIHHNKCQLWFIGIKLNDLNIELDPLDEDIAAIFPVPHRYKFSSFDEVVAQAAAIPEGCEGFVVVDGNFNRVKVKTEWYIQLHHMINNGVMTSERIFHILQIGEEGEILTCFPQYKEEFNTYKSFMNEIGPHANHIYNSICAATTRKEFAEKAKECSPLSAYLFWAYDHNGAPFEEYSKDWGGRDWTKQYQKFEIK